ncbi:hypothetical protein KC19_7G047200 [Ceratodon purpureus]|uniref:LanC-like protein 2 n=1 Tax=Ceratodon purpureus TaxID=3225 RepID=A0A8T0H4N5_CERPU|nr:hypothetical protein KC19_7G047200 [Ceratodon purpureus]
MADRYFPNTMRDYAVSVEDSHAEKRTREAPEHSVLEPDALLKVAMSLKDEVVQATWIRQGRRASDPTLYTGALGTAFLCFKAYQITGSKEDLALCSEIVDSCATAAEPMKKYVTFLCGQPGIYALGAAAAKCRGDQRSLDRYLGLFYENSKNKTLAVGAEEGGMGMPYELLYGRAGFLWAALFVNKHVGEDTVSASITGPIVDAILAGGRAGASQTRSPLMYQWHGTRYWGGAHGLAGIMHTLMHFQLSKEDAADVKGTLRYMIQGRFASGNYPSSEGNARDRLVHWCHGAPGVAMTLCKATQVFPDEEEFQQAAIEAGNVVWNRGLLRRLGLCHGISGNSYVFLSLYRTMGGKQHLFRAQQFASFLSKHARAFIDAGEMHGGDRPHSLFEGLAGTACLFFDLTKPEMSRFPAYEL